MVDKKKKIFLISDDIRATSGVGTQGRFLVEGLIKTGKYSVKQFGGALHHSNLSPVKMDPYGDDLVIFPVNGFGDKMQIRSFLSTEKPDVMILFTDPRFFMHIFEMEDEIHQICPIIYNTIWDNYPVPRFNHPLYDSCDQLNCINKVVYDSIVSMGLADKAKFIPHTLPEGMYKPLSDYEALRYKKMLFGEERADHFMPIFVSRNAKRKQPGDILNAWSMFLKRLQEREGHKKATLIFHADPNDQEGPNLYEMIEMLGINDNVFISKQKIEFEKMNILYNIADVNILISSAEGFGLSILEAKSAGTPSIVQKTGGMTYQVYDADKKRELGIILEPDVTSLVGSQLVPYIYDDYLNWKTIGDAFWKAYKWKPEEKAKLKEWCLEDVKARFVYSDMINSWDKSIEETIERFCREKNNKKYTIDVL